MNIVQTIRIFKIMHLIYCHLLAHLMQQLSYLARLAFLYRLRLGIVDVPAQPIQPVSYTHLMLPTILLV